MIYEGEAAIPLETTRRAFLNQEKSKQRSAIVPDIFTFICIIFKDGETCKKLKADGSSLVFSYKASTLVRLLLIKGVRFVNRQNSQKLRVLELTKIDSYFSTIQGSN